MSKYRESIKDKLRSVSASTKTGTENFFNKGLGEKERLEAFKAAGSFVKDDIMAARKVLDDESEPTSIRTAALRGLIHQLANDEEMMDELLGILTDDKEPASLKNAALNSLQSITFSSVSFASKRPAYINALRHLVNKGTKQIRLKAIEYLALGKDEYVQRLLIDGLENPAKSVIEPEKAIQLLSYDLHADYYPILRKIVQNPPNPRSKKEALRNLAADAESVDLLLNTLNNKKEDSETRHVCAVGLQSIAPGKLYTSLKKLLLDDDEDEELKVALMNTVNHAVDTSDYDNDAELMEKLSNNEKKLATTSRFSGVFAQFLNRAKTKK